MTYSRPICCGSRGLLPRRLRRRRVVLGSKLGANRPVHDVLVQAHDEDESVQVEEELHGLKDLERVHRQAPVQVVDEHDEAADPSRGQLTESTVQLGEGRDIERLRVVRVGGRGQRRQGGGGIVADGHRSGQANLGG